MIISRTPFRISFAGGGSDLKEYYKENEGAVLSVTINKYMYLSMHPYFHEEKFFLKYSKNEIVNHVNEIEHPIIRTIFQDYGFKGIDFNSSADIPSGTGLASSSAFTVGLINLCNTFTGKYMSKEEIAHYACDIEISRLNEPIGKQDQYACAVGGLNFLTFHRNDTVSVEKVILSPLMSKSLEDRLILFYLGTTRTTKSILSEQRKNMVNDHAKMRNLSHMVELAHKLRKELMNQNIDAIGEIMHEGWELKKTLASKISNVLIDEYYTIARKNGAIGGKLLGAGGGGFFLFFVKKEKRNQLKAALNMLMEVNFQFDYTGTTIIY